MKIIRLTAFVMALMMIFSITSFASKSVKENKVTYTGNGVFKVDEEGKNESSSTNNSYSIENIDNILYTIDGHKNVKKLMKIDSSRFMAVDEIKTNINQLKDKKATYDTLLKKNVSRDTIDSMYERLEKANNENINVEEITFYVPLNIQNDNTITMSAVIPEPGDESKYVGYGNKIYKDEYYFISGSSSWKTMAENAGVEEYVKKVFSNSAKFIINGTISNKYLSGGWSIYNNIIKPIFGTIVITSKPGDKYSVRNLYRGYVKHTLIWNGTWYKLGAVAEFMQDEFEHDAVISGHSRDLGSDIYTVQTPNYLNLDRQAYYYLNTDASHREGVASYWYCGRYWYR